MSPARGLRVGFLEPHLELFGGIRRVLEFGNRLVDRGHQVTYYVPDDQPLTCRWMRCEGAVKTIDSGRQDILDVLVFNHEPQWHLLDRFTGARRRVFYALHYGKLYGKEGSWESLRAEVDLQLANSAWTADRIEEETGSRPVVQLGGVNREVFRPHGGPKRWPLLCAGQPKPWKGTDTIREAAQLAGVPVEEYASRNLSQTALGRAYDAAEVFVVGSWYEGFCQPGLESLASGVPLVTTDNGGCLEYATDGVTALVVPPRDAEAMAGAIRRLLDEPDLAGSLRGAGLELVERTFDWEQRTDELVERLDGVVAGTLSTPPAPRPAPPAAPELSIVVPVWDNLVYTQRFVESVRQTTGRPYELIMVDNGSAADTADYVAAAADHTVRNPRNRGFAAGMNQGLALASGSWVAFCNNDTVLPERWAERLLETADRYPEAGIIVPAITQARNELTVRATPGTDVTPLPPFSAPPAAVIYLMRRDIIDALGGWGEEYRVASGEDVDLAFKVWVNDLDIVFDERVLVEHVGKGSASRLDDWEALWAENRGRFLEKWQGPEEVPRLVGCTPERHARNRATARAVATWMERYFRAREGAGRPRTRSFTRRLAGRGERLGRRIWRRTHHLIPDGPKERIRHIVRGLLSRR